jgi:hypothetical protein
MKAQIINYWFDNGNKFFGVYNWKKIRERNIKEFGKQDPDYNTKRRWGIRTNGAKKGIDTCLDLTIDLGHIEINYINFKY